MLVRDLATVLRSMPQDTPVMLCLRVGGGMVRAGECDSVECGFTTQTVNVPRTEVIKAPPVMLIADDETDMLLLEALLAGGV